MTRHYGQNSADQALPVFTPAPVQFLDWAGKRSRSADLSSQLRDTVRDSNLDAHHDARPEAGMAKLADAADD